MVQVGQWYHEWATGYTWCHHASPLFWSCLNLHSPCHACIVCSHRVWIYTVLEGSVIILFSAKRNWSPAPPPQKKQLLIDCCALLKCTLSSSCMICCYIRHVLLSHSCLSKEQYGYISLYLLLAFYWIMIAVFSSICSGLLLFFGGFFYLFLFTEGKPICLPFKWFSLS